MPTVFLSTKLQSFAGFVGLRSLDKTNGFDAAIGWNARVFLLKRRKCIIVTHKSTLYSFVRLNVVKKDFTGLHTFFVTSLLNQMRADKLYNGNKNVHQINLLKVEFCRTDNDKKVIGSMNDFMYQIKMGVEYNATGLVNLTDVAVGTYVNTIPMGFIGYNTALEKIQASKELHSTVFGLIDK